MLFCYGVTMLTARETEDVSDPVFQKLYDVSFTSEEKIPLDNIKRTFGKGGKLHFYYDSEAFIGFTYCFEHESITFFVYFTTCPEFRNKGYGSKILDMMKQRYSGKRIFLVIEPLDENAPDFDIRVRRHRFYERNGWNDSGTCLLSDGYYFDSMYLGEPIDGKEMSRAVEYYEKVHNGGVSCL